MCSMARTTQTKQTAAACYEERHAECQRLLKRIPQQLSRHQKEQASEPAYWGFPGDLGHITEELANVLASLGDRSAVDAKGLEC
jgi:type VI protein secretion system component VasK